MAAVRRIDTVARIALIMLVFENVSYMRELQIQLNLCCLSPTRCQHQMRSGDANSAANAMAHVPPALHGLGELADGGCIEMCSVENMGGNALPDVDALQDMIRHPASEAFSARRS